MSILTDTDLLNLDFFDTGLLKNQLLKIEIIDTLKYIEIHGNALKYIQIY